MKTEEKDPDSNDRGYRRRLGKQCGEVDLGPVTMRIIIEVVSDTIATTHGTSQLKGRSMSSWPLLS